MPIRSFSKVVKKDNVAGAAGSPAAGATGKSRMSNVPKEKSKCEREVVEKIKSKQIKEKDKKAAIDKCIHDAKNKEAFNFYSKISNIIKRFDSLSAIPRRMEAPVKYSNDVLQVESPKLVNGSFKPESINGISEHRPELIAMAAFKPVYENDPKEGYLSSHGKLIELQHQISMIRKQNLLELFNDMQENHSEKNLPEAQEIFNNLRDEYNKSLEKLEALKSFYAQSLSDVETLHSLLNIKKKSELVANQEQQEKYLETKDFFKQYMGYSESSYNLFTGTKIYLQMASDFRQVLQNYSFNLLDLEDSNRIPNSPTKIDTSITINDGFSFNVEQLQSPSELKNAAQASFFTNFMKSLPIKPADRLKILITLMSKEYRVSMGLGTRDIANLIKNAFNSGDQGNPFDNIIGIPSTTIFTPAVGPNSLSALTYDIIPVEASLAQQNLIVLPFEEKYIDDVSSNKTYVPGKSYYIDSIFDLQRNLVNGQFENKFNVGPLLKFADEFKTTTNNVYESVMRLMNFSPESGQPVVPELHSDSIYGRLLSAILSSISSTGLRKKVGSGFSGKDVVDQKSSSLQSFTIGLIRLANKDNQLKFLLFQYCLMVGLISNLSKNPNVIWSDLARELNTIENFGSIGPIDNSNNSNQRRQLKDQEISLLKGPSMVIPFLKKLAEDIEKRTRTIILKNVDQFDGGLNSNPNVARRIVARLKDKNKKSVSLEIVPKSFLGTPEIAQINEKYIYNVLLQIASEINHEKESNVFREFVDFCNKITSNSNVDGRRAYLLADGSGRTRFNLISPSVQLLTFFEMFCSVFDAFSFIDLGRTKTNIITEANVELMSLVYQEADKLVRDRFVGEKTTIGGLSKEIRNEVGDVNLDDLIVQKFGKDDKIVKSKLANKQSVSGNFAEIPLDNQTKRNIASLMTIISEKISKEKFIIFNFLHIFNNIANQISLAKTKALSFYNDGTIKNFYDNFKDIGDIRSLNSVGHIRTSAFLINNQIRNSVIDFNNSEEYSAQQGLREEGQEIVRIKTPIVSNVIPAESKEAMYSLLSENMFSNSVSAETTVKIASVGIPAGFVKATYDRAKVNETQPSSFQAKQNSVVYVNIYKRDMRRDDLIFKPQKFLFDLNLFVGQNNIRDFIKPEAGQRFHRILQGVTVTDMENISSPEFYSYDESGGNNTNIKLKNKFGFLNNSQKQAMFENHVKSYLLEEYVKLSSGVKISEDTFLNNKLTPYIISEEFESFLISYLRDNLGENINQNQNIQQILNSPSVSSDSKQTIREILWGNAIATPTRTRERILGLKKFDRVLNIAFNIDDFEIDIEETRKTMDGKNMLNNLKISKGFRTEMNGSERKTYLKRRTKDSVIFEDYFITVETLND